MKWQVIHTKFREEFKALENLKALRFFCPHVKFKKMQGKIKLAIEPLFIRYLFIRLSDVTSN
jgi:Transcription termination factor nusG